MIDLVLKIKNNTKLDLTNVHVYTIVNDEVEVGSTYKETKENTALEDISSANLTAGEEELCHLYTAVNKSVDVGELLVRFNLGGVCYYCEIEE